MFSFEINKKIPGKLGRAGVIHTPHGDIQTPAFIVVGTKATVKAMTPEMVRECGGQAVLGNTYHLYLQPGDDIVAQGGGISEFMNWNGPTFTDSGGFQVFSLGEAFGTKVSKVANGDDQMVSEKKGPKNKLATIDEEGVTFKSHLNGQLHRITPERSMQIQWNLGADIIFAFDECTSPLADHEYQRAAMDRTHRWAKRCIDEHEKLDSENIQALFGVVQGGRHEDLRKESAETLAAMNFDGFGIGGSFNKEDMATAVGWVNEILPEEKPRHLLGIGDPIDIFLGVEAGCDTFDCVTPTRLARHGHVYTRNGVINLRKSQYKTDFSPIDTATPSYTSKNYTRAYLAHLYRSNEMLAGTLGSIHNIYFIVNLVKEIRQAILEDRFEELKEEFFNSYKM
ncbi:tRNA guanosine(34) transglycosylase Tgt [Candidatus Nomurabacteria bacterium]|nr:tRNA guanosine(34) transglycosylase Tgt [Candidatus Nomurabacteria bacterium]